MSNNSISIVDVGHGNSTILSDEGDVTIIDCGARGAALLEYLENRGITRINAIYLSHSDQDHIGGLITVLATGRFEIGSIYLNSDASKGTKLWDDLVFLLDEQDGKTVNFQVSIHEGMSTVKSGEIELLVTGPSKYLIAKGAGGKDRLDRTITSNSISASFLVKYRSAPVVFLGGDIDQVGLDELEYKGQCIFAPILVFPHHGGRPDGADTVRFAEKVYEMVKPNSVVFSTGRNKFDNPKPEIVKTLRSKGTHVRIACTQLATSCASKLPIEDPIHLHPFYAKGKSQRECCCGTFVIELVSEKELREFPETSIHQEFISKFAATALCKH